jgi:hypothetical protein
MPTARSGVAPFAVIPGMPVLLCHTVFDVNAAGELVHYSDGKLRATVPPEGWDDYARAWPGCAELVAELRAVQPIEGDAAAGQRSAEDQAGATGDDDAPQA